MEGLISCRASKRRAGCVLEKFEHGVVFIRMLLGNEFVIVMEDVYIHLLIWK